MTGKQIDAKATLEAKRFEAAKHIREYLDVLKKDVGTEYADNDWESNILEMVTE